MDDRYDFGHSKPHHRGTSDLPGMSPVSEFPSRSRRMWRAAIAGACVLSAASVLVTAIKWTGTDRRQDRQSAIATKAICAIIDYSEDTLRTVREHPERATPAATKRFRQLTKDMKSTGITCSPSQDSPTNGR